MELYISPEKDTAQLIRDGVAIAGICSLYPLTRERILDWLLTHNMCGYITQDGETVER